MKKRLFVLIMTPILLFSACAKTDKTPKEIDYHSIILNYQEKELELGKSVNLSVNSGLPKDKTKDDISWISSNKNVAYVDEEGLVYAYKEGECTITAFIDENGNGQLDEKEYYGDCQITDILHKGVNLTLSALKVNLQMEHTASINAYITPAPESGNYFYLSFTSENSNIAYANKNSEFNTTATVKASGLGETTITVKYGGQTAKFKVQVDPWIDGDKTHVASLEFDQKQVVINKETSANPTYNSQLTIYPSTATDKKVTYSSNNTEVATVDENGVVTGLKGGSAIITATSNDLKKTDKMLVTVKDTYTTYETDLYSGYYSGLTTWENGEDLINKLHAIIKDYTPQSYASSGEWTDLRKIDEALDNPASLDTIYSLLDIDKTEQSNSYNREHAFCASLMTGFTTGDATSQKGRATDYHNLFAAAKSGNSARNNKNFGYANPNDASYTVSEEGYSADRLNFEPGDVDKGRLARALFYMTTMYNEDEIADVTDTLNYNEEDAETYGHGSKTVHIVYTQKALQVREEYANYSKVSFSKFHYHEDEESQALYEKYVTVPEGDYTFDELLDAEIEGYGKYSTANCDFAIGNLSNVLEFASFPLDYSEYKRNDVVQSVQGNRNPFIDYPELINYAYGNLKDQPGNLANIRPSEEILDTDSGDIVCYSVSSYKNTCAIGTTFDSSCYTLQAVKSDLSKVDADDSVDLSKPYVFTETDVENGFAIYPVVTTLNTINLKIKVTSVDVESANYKFSNFRSTLFADKKITSTPQEVNLNGVIWLVSSTNEVAITNVNTPVTAIKIGTASKPAGTITFKTKEAMKYEDMDKVAALFIQGNAASKENFSVAFEVGTFNSGSNLLEYNASSYPVVGAVPTTPVAGVVTIKLTGISSYINLQTIGIKTVA